MGLRVPPAAPPGLPAPRSVRACPPSGPVPSKRREPAAVRFDHLTSARSLRPRRRVPQAHDAAVGRRRGRGGRRPGDRRHAGTPQVRDLPAADPEPAQADRRPGRGQHHDLPDRSPGTAPSGVAQERSASKSTPTTTPCPLLAKGILRRPKGPWTAGSTSSGRFPAAGRSPSGPPAAIRSIRSARS